MHHFVVIYDNLILFYYHLICIGCRLILKFNTCFNRYLILYLLPFNTSFIAYSLHYFIFIIHLILVYYRLIWSITFLFITIYYILMFLPFNITYYILITSNITIAIWEHLSQFILFITNGVLCYYHSSIHFIYYRGKL